MFVVTWTLPKAILKSLRATKDAETFGFFLLSSSCCLICLWSWNSTHALPSQFPCHPLKWSNLTSRQNKSKFISSILLKKHLQTDTKQHKFSSPHATFKKSHSQTQIELICWCWCYTLLDPHTRYTIKFSATIKAYQKAHLIWDYKME